MPLLIAFASLFSEDALTNIVSFAILGIYASLRMVVLAALRARLKGRHPAGEFTLGRWGLAVNIGALAGLRHLRDRQHLLGTGLLHTFTTHHYGRGNAPSGDAVPEG